MMMLEIMEKYHWDYYTYQAQPIWMVNMIVEKMKIDAMKKKQQESLKQK